MCNSGYNFFKCFTNDGGYQTNYIEVGGPDTGVLYATGQTVANIVCGPGHTTTATPPPRPHHHHHHHHHTTLLLRRRVLCR